MIRIINKMYAIEQNIVSCEQNEQNTPKGIIFHVFCLRILVFCVFWHIYLRNVSICTEWKGFKWHKYSDFDTYIYAEESFGIYKPIRNLFIEGLEGCHLLEQVYRHICWCNKDDYISELHCLNPCKLFEMLNVHDVQVMGYT